MTLLPERASLDARPVPGWYTDAKLGIFVHRGLHSIPAFAEADAGDFATYMRDLAAGKDTKGRVPYAGPGVGDRALPRGHLRQGLLLFRPPGPLRP